MDSSELGPRQRGRPVNTLLARTVDWILELPPLVRPHLLAANYARVANQLCFHWTDPEACWQYFGELFIDRRGGRKGFPLGVSVELRTLRKHYARLHPQLRRRSRRSASSATRTEKDLKTTGSLEQGAAKRAESLSQWLRAVWWAAASAETYRPSETGRRDPAVFGNSLAGIVDAGRPRCRSTSSRRSTSIEQADGQSQTAL